MGYRCRFRPRHVLFWRAFLDSPRIPREDAPPHGSSRAGSQKRARSFGGGRENTGPFSLLLPLSFDPKVLYAADGRSAEAVRANRPTRRKRASGDVSLPTLGQAWLRE